MSQTPQPRIESIHSRALEREMPMEHYGEQGELWLYLPTSGGDQTEFARYGFPRVAAEELRLGRMRVCSVDARGPTSLFAPSGSPQERFASYRDTETHLREEWIPAWLQREGAERVSLLAASYGAFVAANLAFKIPQHIAQVVLFGGVFEMNHRLDGWHNEDVYFHTPLEFVGGLGPGSAVDEVKRSQRWTLFAAEDDPWLDSSQSFSRVLRQQQIDHEFDLWGSPHGHHESTWALQFDKWLRRTHR